MNPKEEKQPKYIRVSLIFEDDDLNQHSLINIEGAKTIEIQNFPEFRQKTVETLGSDRFDTSRVIRMIYCIVVNYGDEGIDINDLNK